ncbi:hypothetical protein [Nocardioides alkalitolerans]|uniref:hypothetical protein n=1 Tax=Nocardioides alkalitolerans TaxID=281714 RepID=UPI00040F7D7E|nr:hypothetical protein [Nocardioides alkalitolerans]
MNSASTVMNRPTTTVDPQRKGLHLALALVVGALVASPGLPELANNGALLFALAASGVILYLLRKRPAVHPRAGRVARTAAVAGAFVAALVLLSVSFGIAAADAHLWVVAPAVLAFLVTFGAARTADS